MIFTNQSKYSQNKTSICFDLLHSKNNGKKQIWDTLVSSGPWAVNRKTEDSQWAVNSGYETVGSGQWAVNSGQWTVGSGWLAVNSG
jgi:hypothetical protein